MAETFGFCIATAVPILFLLLLIPDEKSRMLIWFFVWGIAAFILAGWGNDLVEAFSHMSISKMQITTGPLVEEFFKTLPLIVLFFLSRKMDYSMIAIAMASGIGFSIQENYHYIMPLLRNSSQTVILYLLVRSVSTCLMHGLTTAIIGYGIDHAKQQTKPSLAEFFGLFSLAVTFHAIFNLYITSAYMFIGAVIPILLYVIGVLFFVSDNQVEGSI